MTRLPAVFVALAAAAAAAFAQSFPVRGLHIAAPNRDEIALAERFIKEALPREGVNTIVIEFNYRVQSQRRPAVTEPNALAREDVARLVAAARVAQVRLIPGINLLGHQSWAKNTSALLRAHPEFDETPSLYPENQGIYCRSYCPLHPQVHDVVFDLIDELAELCQADAFHAGMDEVFLLGEDACPRCRGKNKAELFANEVRAVHDHLAQSGREMWIWSDRLLNGVHTGLGRWEAAHNGTEAALGMIPKDVVLCDWHYEMPWPTAAHFAVAGFPVVSAPWRKSQVALRQLDQMRLARRGSAPALADRFRGMLQTTWCGFGPFARAYFGEDLKNVSAVEAVACFRELYRELRAGN